jgi:hypothetical protein
LQRESRARTPCRRRCRDSRAQGAESIGRQVAGWGEQPDRDDCDPSRWSQERAISSTETTRSSEAGRQRHGKERPYPNTGKPQQEPRHSARNSRIDPEPAAAVSQNDSERTAGQGMQQAANRPERLTTIRPRARLTTPEVRARSRSRPGGNFSGPVISTKIAYDRSVQRPF